MILEMLGKVIFSIFSSGNHFVPWIINTCAVLKESIMRNMNVKLFWFCSVVKMTFIKGFSTFSFQQSGTVCAILVESMHHEEQ